MDALTVITRDDLIRAGGCYEGVYVAADRHFPEATAVPVAIAIGAAGKNARLVQCTANTSGYGDGGCGDGGYGDGDGDGYGGGYGYGGGDSDGDGDSDGYGGYGGGYGDGYGE